MQKVKDMYQKKMRIPEDVRLAVISNGEKESRKFNTEVIHQLRKVYGLIDSKQNAVAQ